MEKIVGIRYVEAGPISYCSPGELDLGVGDYVVVHTDRGERLGWVVLAPDQVLGGTPEGPVRVVDRLASEADVDAWRAQKRRAEEDVGRAQAIATRSDPRIRVASIDFDLAGDHAELTFTAPERVESNWLRKQVAELLQADLRVQQVGDRDRAKALGGLGVCGRALCCATWQTEFPSISIKMAKEQDLSPNPSKISGVCGRLLCCLSFEVEAYRELRGDLPKVGKTVSTPIGRARVLSVNALKQIVRMRMQDTGEVIEIPAEQLRAQFGTAVRPTELEDQIERPLKARDRELKDSMLAVLEPVSQPAGADRRPAYRTTEDVDAPAQAGSPEARATAAPIAGRRPARPPSAAEATSDGPPAEGQSDEPKKRRRRGRRGGRRRRRPDGTDAGALEGAADGAEE